MAPFKSFLKATWDFLLGVSERRMNLLFVGVLMMLGGSLRADDISDALGSTASAQALSALISAIGTNPHAWMQWVMSIFLGLVLSTWGQNIIEVFAKQIPNPFIKVFGSLIVGILTSTITAVVGHAYGITPAMAAVQLATFLGAVHLFNGTNWAADLQKVESFASANSGKALPIAQMIATAMGEPAVGQALGAVIKLQQAAHAAGVAGAPAPLATVAQIAQAPVQTVFLAPPPPAVAQLQPVQIQQGQAAPAAMPSSTSGK